MSALRAPKQAPITENTVTTQLRTIQTARNLEGSKFAPITPVESSSRLDLIPPIMKTTTRVNTPDASSGIIHVVQTRFMQGQADLLDLGFARLALFEAFCLPTILSQTNTNFLWIIRTDPHLHPAILDKMIKLIDGRQNFFLIGSNHNPEGFGRSENGPFDHFLQIETNITEAKAIVYSGNITLLEDAYEKSTSGGVLLETRLDADDGVHLNLIESIQEEAKKYLTASDSKENVNALWRMWCVHSNIEWHPSNPYPDSPDIRASIIKNGNKSIEEGYLVMYADPNLCITPGLTFGYGAGAGRSSIGDRIRHDQIMKKIMKCGQKSKGSDKIIEVNCVSRLASLVPGAVRTRTTTSAGMQNVFTGDEEMDKNVGLKKKTKNEQLIQQYFEQNKLWNGLRTFFSISKESAMDARWLIIDRSKEIAEDNLRGQCTKGHWCKERAQILLQKLADAPSVQRI